MDEQLQCAVTELHRTISVLCETLQRKHFYDVAADGSAVVEALDRIYNITRAEK